MDPWAMYITHGELPPPVVVPRRKKRLKQLQLQLELELEQDNVCYASVAFVVLQFVGVCMCVYICLRVDVFDCAIAKSIF